jgi:hypothetical protein
MGDVGSASGWVKPFTTCGRQIDETAADSSGATGKVWSITMYLPLEELESYSEDLGVGRAVFQTWIDDMAREMTVPQASAGIPTT